MSRLARLVLMFGSAMHFAAHGIRLERLANLPNQVDATDIAGIRGLAKRNCPNLYVAIALDEQKQRNFNNGQTDADGRIRWRLPIGRYKVAAATQFGHVEEDKSTTIEWTERGPSPSEVSLSIKPK